MRRQVAPLGSPPPSLRRPRPALLAAFLSGLVLLATVDERSFGVIPDGQEMLSAATALVRFGELGISRDFVYAVRRPGGDATTRYGMGQTLLVTLPAAAGLALQGALPHRSSAPLFVLLPIALLAAVAGAGAWTAELAGAARATAVLLGMALALATPLWGYGGSDYSEPLQVAAMAALVAAVVALRLRGCGARWERAAGAAAGIALLAKSSLIAPVVPLLWAAVTARVAQEPVTRPRKKAAPPDLPRWRVLRAFAPPALLWLAFELYRFGTLFGGYRGERFSYPFLAGLLRLTLFPNKGLLFYAPLVLLAVPGYLAARRRDPRLALALAAAAAAVLLPAAGWWAWDGQAAWGPRLVLPALPILFAFLAIGLPPAGRATRIGALALGLSGVAVNALGALMPFPQVYALATAATPQPMPERRARGTEYEVARREDGLFDASAPHHLSLTPSWAPQRVHARAFFARLSGKPVVDTLSKAFDPPFQVIVPEEPAPALRAALSGFGWPFWGRSWLAPLPGQADPLAGALRDQAIRALDVRDYSRAGRLAAALGPEDPVDLAIAAEAAALGGDPVAADALLRGAGASCHPWILFVRLRRGGDASCVPEPQRAGFEQGVRAALAAGAPLSVWGRGGS